MSSIPHSTSAQPRQASDPGLPALGVGLTYSSAIEPVLDRHPELIDVLEIEPQTTWIESLTDPGHYRIADEVLAHLVRLPGRKVVHSIGVPVGGTVRPSAAQLALLRQCVNHLQSPWASEHLSFNATPDFRTGFFLPARQTPAGVDVAAAAIQALQADLPVPLAVETGVNYLRRRDDELPDGTFVRAVLESAGCGLLLDLHNVYTNALNGRQPVDEFLDQLPLDRVWEIHLAGGFEMDGYWLDAHSGSIPDDLIAIAAALVPRLPHLKAIIFEIYPSFVPRFGLDGIRAELERLHDLWDRRPRVPSAPMSPARVDLPAVLPRPDAIPPPVWEQTLGGLVIGRTPDESVLARQLAADPGIDIVHRMVSEFRASLIVGTLRLTSRLLMLALGGDIFRTILEGFWSTTPPQGYGSTEAQAFADYLAALNLPVPHLAVVLEFERAVVATLVDDQSRVVTFQINPLPLFRALAEGHLLDEPTLPGTVEIEITPGATVQANGVGLESAQQVFPFH